MDPIKVGICGFGTVGSGTLAVLRRNRHDIAARVGRDIIVTHIGARRDRPGRGTGDTRVSRDVFAAVRDPEGRARARQPPGARGARVGSGREARAVARLLCGAAITRTGGPRPSGARPPSTTGSRSPPTARTAPAWAGLATLEILARRDEWWAPDGPACRRVQESALRALTIDAQDAEAHAAYGWSLGQCSGDPAQAEQQFLMALERSPGDPLARAAYAAFLGVHDRFEERLAQTRRALESDPLSPEIHVDLARCHLYPDAPVSASGCSLAW